MNNNSELLKTFYSNVLDLLKQKKYSEAKNFLLNSYPSVNKDVNFYFYLGLTEKNLSLFDNALISFQNAINKDKRHINSYVNIANIFNIRKQFDESVQYLKIALQINPSDEKIIYLLARAYKNNHQFKESIAEFNKIKTNFKNEKVLLNLAESYKQLKRNDDAIEKYKSYLKINNSNLQVYLELGNLYKEKKMFIEALKLYGDAERLDPKDHRSYLAVSRIVKDKRKAIEFLDKAYKLSGNKPSIYVEKIMEQAKICDWSFWQNPLSNLRKLYNLNANLNPFGVFFLDDDPQLHQKIANKSWNRIEKKINSCFHDFNNKNKKIKIGYVTPDINSHPVMYITLPLFKNFDKTKFEVYAYSIFKHPNNIERVIVKTNSSFFFDVHTMDTLSIVELIRSHKIDILIDLAGYTKNCKPEIFAHKPAPIQINYCGFPGTMGTNKYDYIISDKSSIPQKNEKFVDEKIIFMPKSSFTYDNQIGGEVNYSRAEFNLPEDKITLCCFNNPYKITPFEFDVWMSMLKKNKNAVFVLRYNHEEIIDNLKMEAKKRQVDSNQLFFIKFLPHQNHLAVYKLMDLFLDTFNFNAVTTALEALYMGVPVITKCGEKVTARAASGILKAHGLDHLVCKSIDEYEKLIQFYLDNPDELKKIKNKTLENKKTCSLFDNHQYVKKIEKAYIKIYDNFHNNIEPQNVYLE